MIIGSEYMKDLNKIRQQNNKWKQQIDRQVLEKQIKKLQRIKIEQELIRMQQEKINKSNKQALRKSKQGIYQVTKLKLPSILSSPSINKPQRNKTQISKKNLSFSIDQGITWIPESNIDISFSPIKPIKQENDQPIYLNFPQSSIRKKKRSSTNKRQSTEPSINYFQPQHFQQQNKKLKEQIRNRDIIIEKIIKSLNVNPEYKHLIKQTEQLLKEKNIKLSSSSLNMIDYQQQSSKTNSKGSPSKLLFPSLNFNNHQIISQYNLLVAKRANHHT